MIARRLEGLRAGLAAAGLPAALIESPANRFYLTGFPASSGYLLVGERRATFFTDGRYIHAAAAALADGPIEVRLHGRPYQDDLKAWLAEEGARRLGFEAEAVSYRGYEAYREALPEVELTPLPPLVERLRAVKDEAEVAAVASAVALTEAALAATLAEVRVGMTEEEVRRRLECRLLELGAEAVAFPLIVVSGERTALPHGVPGPRPLGPGDLLTVDVGVRLGGYVSDITRTYAVRRWTAKTRALYEAVAAAQAAALDVVRAGVAARDVDAAARRVLSERGLGEAFVHATGHGIGLEVHERPHLAASSEETLAAGMVLTLEPGVYVPGVGGVRIEDDVLVRQEGAEVLTKREGEPPLVDP